ncbi:MAG: hypothetical protein CYPHOPRED_003360 [Cyphobasidiales sp. Tagirdzhanova-0007]|nr:MAG: hypothetical protein CYPHOPRED_003360 [Cyphobasidiales sp. Tagirdzhanova-0007]
MSHPFTQAQVNSYLPIFQEQANKLRDMIKDLLEHPVPNEKDVRDEWTVVEVAGWLSRTTLDIIGLAGFSHSFGALDNTNNKLGTAFAVLLHPPKLTSLTIILQLLTAYIPVLVNIPTRQAKNAKAAMEIMEGEGRKMVQIRKEWAENGELDDKIDLMSLLVKANLNVLNKKDKMLDVELMGQVATFIMAGHDTSSTTVAWILMYMSTRPEIQKKLREEVQRAKAKAATEDRSELKHEEISSLPYMDAVVKETLRCVPPVLEWLLKPLAIFLKVLLQIHDYSRYSARRSVMIGISSFNRTKTIFGEDAHEFRPERWLEKEIDDGLQLAKGFTTLSPLLTFLGGPRGCIGYRFALLEVKTILATLIAAFEFLERDEGGTPLTMRSTIVTRPVVIGEENLGPRLPLRVRKVAQV